MLGGDYEETVKRLINEKILGKFAMKFTEDKTYAEMCEGMKEKDWEKVFRAAHTMKGISRNLGFTALYEASDALTERIRSGGYSGAEELFEKTAAEYERTIEAIKKS